MKRDLALINAYQGICPDLGQATPPQNDEIDLAQLRQDAIDFRKIDEPDAEEIMSAVL